VDPLGLLSLSASPLGHGISLTYLELCSRGLWFFFLETQFEAKGGARGSR